MSPSVISHHYPVKNFSSFKLKLDKIQNQQVDDELMPIGTVISPGETGPFGVTYHIFGPDPFREAHFSVLDPKTGANRGTVVIHARYSYSPYKYSYSPYKSEPDPRQTKVEVLNQTPLTGAAADSNGFSFTDKLPSVIDIPTGDAPQQVAIFRSLCSDGNAAKCAFAPTGYQPNILSPARDVVSYANYGKNDAPLSHTKGVEFTESNSLDIGLTATTKLTILGQEVSAEFSAAYGHTWATATTDSTTVGANVAPGHVGLITEQHPVDRIIGDLVLTLGNTTWKLHDVVFDSPLKVESNSTHFAYYEWQIGQSRPSPEELAKMPPITPHSLWRPQGGARPRSGSSPVRPTVAPARWRGRSCAPDRARKLWSTGGPAGDARPARTGPTDRGASTTINARVGSMVAGGPALQTHDES